MEGGIALMELDSSSFTPAGSAFDSENDHDFQTNLNPPTALGKKLFYPLSAPSLHSSKPYSSVFPPSWSTIIHPWAG
jgi:hypothetical protein